MEPFPFPNAKVYTADPDLNLIPIYPTNLFKIATTQMGNRAFATTNLDRILVMKRLLDLFPGPFSLLLVIQEPNGAFMHAGRYTSEEGKSRIHVDYFLDYFHDYISYDGFLHLWICCDSTGGKVIYDQHDWFNIYGKADESESVFRELGFVEREAEKLPPHAHCKRHDIYPGTKEMLEYGTWRLSPLELADVARPEKKSLLNSYLGIRSWFAVRRAIRKKSE